jgi:hypothetical protein
MGIRMAHQDLHQPRDLTAAPHAMLPAPEEETASTIITLVSKVFGAVLIPSVATIIFNLLNFFFENYHKDPLPPLTDSVYNISVDCAFSSIGIAVTVGDSDLAKQFIILFVVMLFLILGGLIMPVFAHWSRFYTVWCINLISLFVLSWAITTSD